eukprot:1680123-Amphidinium_carterae.1
MMRVPNVRRLPESQRKDETLSKAVRGMPWRPKGTSTQEGEEAPIKIFAQRFEGLIPSPSRVRLDGRRH